MNIVQVNLIEDKYKKRYTYKVPNNITLSKNDVVMVKNQNHSEHTAICVTDSEDLSDNAIDMIMGGTEVLSEVIGEYKFYKFETNNAIHKEDISVHKNPALLIHTTPLPIKKA